MKPSNSIFIGWQGAILAIAVIVAALLVPTHCQAQSTALLLQQTPILGGEISLGIGIHYFDLNAEVTLTAVPKPGYQFVYWLGDVSDSTANSTVTYLDAPKIIVAVFERAEYEFLVGAESPLDCIPDGGGFFASAVDYTRQGWTGGGGRKPMGPPDPPEWIPEPATGVLLILGSLLTFTRRRAKR